MPETPEEMFARAADKLRMPEVETWDTFPFDGVMRPRPLREPEDVEVARHGEGGVDCHSCARADDRYLWTGDHWRLHAPERPSGLPVVVILETRAHFGEPGDLPDDLAAELGVMIARIERAVRSVGNVGRVHVCRWGDGGEHLHWWFMGRPARMPQLLGSFAAIWDDILPPVPEATWRADLATIAGALTQ